MILLKTQPGRMILISLCGCSGLFYFSLFIYHKVGLTDINYFISLNQPSAVNSIKYDYKDLTSLIYKLLARVSLNFNGNYFKTKSF